MVSTPELRALTTPDPSIVAMAGAVLVQEPPVVALLSVIVAFSHTVEAPVMLPREGVASTVTTVVVAVEPII